MSVLIKGMDMPKDCDSCFMVDKCKHRHYELMKFAVLKRSGHLDEYGDFGSRLVKDDCPLIEVPTPHGDLIDGNKMEFRKEDREDGGEIWLWKADTIIPAEE